MILNRDRFAILSDIWGRFRSLSLISPVTPTVGPGDDGFLWIDIGIDGTPENPLWKMWDEHAATWRLIGGGSGAVDWDDVTGKPSTFPPETHTHEVTWDDVTGKPSTFPPETHTHEVTWDDVTGKPSTFPPETHTHSKLVASDGSPDPAWSCDASGHLSSASGLTLTVSSEAYVKGDKAGLMNRIADQHQSITDHFRSGTIPSGYGWAWSSTPTRLYYSYYNDYLRVTANQNTTHHLREFLGAANPGWSGKHFIARMASLGGAWIELCGIGLSVRISGVWYYAIMMLNRTGTKDTQYVIQVTTNLPGASGYTTGAFGRVGEFVTMDLYVHTDYNIYTYIRDEVGVTHGLGAIGCNVSTADAGEIGLIFQNTHASSYGVSLVDWFSSQF